jgi:hypothetical protein
MKKCPVYYFFAQIKTLNSSFYISRIGWNSKKPSHATVPLTTRDANSSAVQVSIQEGHRTKTGWGLQVIL